MRVSRRVNDIVKYQSPHWLVEPPPLVKGRCVLVVDEICASNEHHQVTLRYLDGNIAQYE